MSKVLHYVDHFRSTISGLFTLIGSSGVASDVQAESVSFPYIMSLKYELYLPLRRCSSRFKRCTTERIASQIPRIWPGKKRGNVSTCVGSHNLSSVGVACPDRMAYREGLRSLVDSFGGTRCMGLMFEKVSKHLPLCLMPPFAYFRHDALQRRVRLQFSKPITDRSLHSLLCWRSFSLPH